MKYITNGHWRDFRYGHEVPADILKRDFDWLDINDALDGFIHYRGTWSHISEYFAPSSPAALPDCPIRPDGYMNDCYFSGTVIELSDDGERYRIALYLN